jgi:hypothetical protein
MMEPVTITITDDYELAGVLRVRCHMRAIEIENLVSGSSLDDIVDDTDREVGLMQRLLDQLDAAKAALEAVHGETGGA